MAFGGVVLLFGGAAVGEEASAEQGVEDQRLRDVEEALQRARAENDELRARLDRLEQRATAADQQSGEDELDALRRAAEAAANAPETAEERSTELATDEVFTSGERSLQALNPEISVVIDAGARLQMNDGDPSSLFGSVDGGDTSSSGFFFRHLGLHIETDLDPFSFTKIAVGVSPEGVELGEAYVTWVRAARGLQITLGKFCQQFGVINRWHTPSLDQFDQPLALTEILGPGGLNQIGLSLDWLIPTRSERSSFLLVLQVTTPNNSHLFSGEFFDIPSALLRLQGYFDLNDDTYLQIGGTGMWGMRHLDQEAVAGDPVPAYDENGEPIILYDEHGDVLGPLTTTPAETLLEEFWGHVWLAGADLTLSWAPLNRERYRHVTWRSELYFVNQERREGRLQAVGAYSYIDAGVTERLGFGVRGDVTQPFAIDAEDELRWQVAAYLTWWQSPWVKLRLQYSHADGAGRPMEDRLVLQFVFAAGPHKHERY
jgi:hypothetical protein